MIPTPRIHLTRHVASEMYLRGQAGCYHLQAVVRAGANRLPALPRRLKAIGALEYIIIAAVLIAVVGAGMNRFGTGMGTAFDNLTTKIASQDWISGAAAAPAADPPAASN